MAPNEKDESSLNAGAGVVDDDDGNDGLIDGLLERFKGLTDFGGQDGGEELEIGHESDLKRKEMSINVPQSICVDGIQTQVQRFVLLGDIGEDRTFRGDRAKVLMEDSDAGLNREDVCKAVQRVEKNEGWKLDFGWFLGDNFYPWGIRGGKKTRERQWGDLKATYLPLNIPFFSCLGNHDHGGDVGAQIKFGSANEEQNPEMNQNGLRFWNMPSKFYDVRMGSIHFFVFDTGSGYERNYVEQQVAFLKPLVLSSDATWKIAVGHIPCLSDHRGSQEYLDPLKVLIVENMSAYISGHCHSLQILNLSKPSYEISEKHNGVLQIVSGCAGNEGMLRPFRYDKAMYRSPQKARGFFIVEATEDSLLFRSFVVTARGEPPCEECRVTLQRSTKDITIKKLAIATPPHERPTSFLRKSMRKLKSAILKTP